jgi:hypothetical protein
MCLKSLASGTWARCNARGEPECKRVGGKMYRKHEIAQSNMLFPPVSWEGNLALLGSLYVG